MPPTDRWTATARTTGLLAIALLAGWPAQARAHEEGVLKPASRTLIAGDSLALAGEKFARNATLELALVGVAGRFDLADVRTDGKGAFSSRLLVPDGTAPGTYRLVAVADDGDEAATLDVTVARRTGEHAHGAGEEAAGPAEPSAEPLALARARSPLVTFGALGGIALALAAGLGLLLTGRHDRRPKPT